MSKQPPPAPTASALGPCSTVIQIVGRPGTGSLPSTIAPPDHPYNIRISALKQYKENRIFDFVSVRSSLFHRMNIKKQSPLAKIPLLVFTSDKKIDLNNVSVSFMLLNCNYSIHSNAPAIKAETQNDLFIHFTCLLGL